MTAGHPTDAARKTLPQEREELLRPVEGPLSGFRNLVGKENGEWTRGPAIIAHGVIWMVIVAFISAAIAYIRGEMEPSYTPADINRAGALMFFVLGSVASVIAVVARTQGAIIGEKQLGTAAWVLSKPASRRAFVLAKLVVNYRWLLSVTLLFPALAFYVLSVAVSGAPQPPLLFLGGFAILALGLFFYLALSLFLGTVFESRGPLAGCVFGFMVAGFMIANYAPWLTAAFPWLFFQSGFYLVTEGFIPGYGLVSIPATALWSVLFVYLALQRFKRAEL
ncbi:ABC-2 family transporter protein [Rubrobacter radiotolerans]|uniref:ABC transporter permease subunit n=1 Tax=Rubrobacter radiotolerans TaxID=42256 RepID=A0A023X0L2_RUBRA|nr:ABC transporter permease subunit [Rubrobacter radiotolerans]AHY45564.1 ABC-2 family transporter protein [Rubrobacter radiotolerans]MDX5892978.1 ABC transporter permease subunit [Rubrobacter radiotolerans]SMC02847.1 ABC-2 type transport system permease protein [Rubrobacter radiotolerans DSM 5868]